MSLQRINATEPISPEEFVVNQVRIQNARKALEQMEERNHLGLQIYTDRELELMRQKEELERKVQEGLEAQRLINEIEKVRSRATTGSSARIEEVPHEQQVQRQTQSSRASISNAQSTSSYSQNQGHSPPAVYAPQWPSYGSIVMANPAMQNQGAQHQGTNATLIPGIQPYYAAAQPYNYNTAPSSYRQPIPQQYVPSLAGQQSESSTQVPTVYHPYFYPKQQPQNAYTYQANQSSSIQTPPQAQTLPRNSGASTAIRIDSRKQTTQAQALPQAQARPRTSSAPATAKNDSRIQTAPVVTHPVLQMNQPNQASTSNVSRTSNSAAQIISQIEPNSQSRAKPVTRFIDTHGVPYLDITPEDIIALRKQLELWIRTAPPGTGHRLHTMMYLYKDTEAPPNTWIYVPWEPGSDKYARTNEIDKFFVALAENAQLVSSGVVVIPTAIHQHPPAQPSIATTTIEQSGAQPMNVLTGHPAVPNSSTGKTLAQVINAQSHYNSVLPASPSTGLNKTSPTPLQATPGLRAPDHKSTMIPSFAQARRETNIATLPAISQAPVGARAQMGANIAISNMPYSSSADQARTNSTSVPPPAVQAQPNSIASSAQAPKSPPAIPSGLTHRLPLPSEVDKKHLSKHILFALGKRSRPSFETASLGQPAKRHASEALSGQNIGMGSSAMPSLTVTSHRPDLGANAQNQTSNLAAFSAPSKDALPVVPVVSSSISSSAAPPVATTMVPQVSVANPSATQNAANANPPEKSSITTSAIPAPVASSAVASPVSIPVAHRQQSLPSIAATRPDLMPQSSPVPPSTVQSPAEASSAGPVVTSSSRLSVPPIETLTPDKSVVATPTSAVSTSVTPTVAAPVISVHAPKSHNITTPSAVSIPNLVPMSNDTMPTTAEPTSALLKKGDNLTMNSDVSMKPPNVTAPVTATSSSVYRQNVQVDYSQPVFRVNKQPPSVSQMQYHKPSALLSSNQSAPLDVANQIGSFSYGQLVQHMSSNLHNQPQFLPSPSPQEAGPSSRPTVEAKQQDVERRHKTREIMDYVLVPKASYQIQQHLRSEEAGGMSETEVTRNRLKRLRTYSSSVSTSVVGEEVSDKGLATEYWRDSSLTDSREGEALRLAYSRLQELPCRWDGCDVILNSVNKLVAHLRQHKPKPGPRNLHFTCRWTQCGRRCSVKDAHTENHALQPLRCAYESRYSFFFFFFGVTICQINATLQNVLTLSGHHRNW
ncbi:hypothetical protein BDN70DRAFT_46037 [Pholiota conissans]|uniref:C2H2-type domain-containing protein n=1 Tax=Pholiota conissans TaxID=109636 RepID=A0A9P5Z264_9AGAR|nr:hypothetical protein BDN70DRAFT_46037 [Pholiota conissans]